MKEREEAPLTRNRKILLGVVGAILVAGFIISYFHQRPRPVGKASGPATKHQSPEERIRCYSDSIRQAPRHAAYYFRRALAYEQKGAFRKAYEDVMQAIRLEKDADRRTRYRQKKQQLEKTLQYLKGNRR